MKDNKMRILGAILTLSGMAMGLVLPVNMVHRVQAEVTDKTVAEQPQNVPTVEQVSEQLSKSAVEFEENRGQFDKQVRYRARAAGSTVFLTATEAVYVLPMPESPKTETQDLSEQTDEQTPSKAFALRMKFVGANPDSLSSGEAVREHRTNYFKGSDEANWQTDIPNFGQVRFENVYDGVSMVWHGREDKATQYDFVVAPNANPEQIYLQFEGADRLEADADGNLLIYTEAGVIKQTKPFTYQETQGFRSEVESGFVVEGTSVKFAVGEYDHSKTLTIDPTVNLSNMAYSTFLGGFGNDSGNSIAVDSAGNVYVTGQTFSGQFPTTAGTFDTSLNGSNDAFVTKLNASGTDLIYSTFLGGNGANPDSGSSIAIDSSCNVYLTGFTSSTNYPTTAGAFDTTQNGGTDVFLTKLNATGSALIYSTLIGGTLDDEGHGIAVDSSGNAYLTGITDNGATDYPTTAGVFDTTHNGSNDAFVTKLNSTGSALLYSTFLGGSGNDSGNAIAIDSIGNAYVTGQTFDSTTDYPTTALAFDTTHNGGNDVFVTKLDSGGSALNYSTFLGGTLDDEGHGIAVDSSPAAYLTGTTDNGTIDYPTTAGAFDTTQNGGTDAFVTKMNIDGTALTYSTFLGGSSSDSGASIAIDSSRNAYLTGQTFDTTTDYPTTAGAFDTTHNGSNDVFVTKLNSLGQALIYSTFIGGSSGESGTGIAIDSSGNVYMTGSTADSTTDYPTTSLAFQPTHNGGGTDAFVSKLGDFAIAGKVIDSTTGNPVPNVMVAMSGQISANMLTNADGRFAFTDTVLNSNSTVSAMRSGFTINPALFNITGLDGNRELIFIAQVGSPTGGSGGTLLFENLSYLKGENGSSVTVTVNRTGFVQTTLPVTVDYQTVNESAVSGQDYANTSGILTFNAGENSKTITIPLLNDAMLEPRENFRIELSNPTNDAEIELNHAQTNIQILDEDLSNGNLLISEFRLRGRLGANDEYIKLFNPNPFDVTVFAGDESEGLTIGQANGADINSILTVPNYVSIPAHGHYLLTNNNPSGGFSLIDYPTGIGTTTAVGDRTFAGNIPDNSNLVLLKTSDRREFVAANLLDAVGFGNSAWTAEGNALSAISAENSETCFVRKLTSNGLQDTNNNRADFLLVDNHARLFDGNNGTKVAAALGSPAPESSESLRLMMQSEVVWAEFQSEVLNPTPVPNGINGTLTLYRRITNNTNEPLSRLRLRVIDFPTAGSESQRRYSTRPDFRILSSTNESEIIKGVTLAADHLQPNGGGINSTLTVDSITPQTPLAPGQSVVVAIRLGVMRYGRHPFTVAIEAMR